MLKEFFCHLILKVPEIVLRSFWICFPHVVKFNLSPLPAQTVNFTGKFTTSTVFFVTKNGQKCHFWCFFPKNFKG